MLNSEPLKVFAVLALLVGTVLVFCFSERYVVVEDELLQDAQQLDAGGSWQQSDSGVSVDHHGSGMVRLTSREPFTLTHISQGIVAPQRFRLLQLSAYMKTLGVRKGDEDWKTARVILVSVDARGKEMYSLPHTLVDGYGDNEWRRYQKVFRIDGAAEEIHVSAQLMHATGVMWVKDISLVPVRERAAFIKYRGILIVLWALAIIWITKPVFSNIDVSVGWVLALIVGAGIVSGALMPESIKKYIDRELPHEVYSDGKTMEPILSSGILSSRSGSILREISIYKFGHFVLFSILAAAVILSRVFKKPITCLLGYMILFAACTEIWQFFVDGRGPGVADFFIDVSGVVAGAAIAWMYTRTSFYRQSMV